MRWDWECIFNGKFGLRDADGNEHNSTWRRKVAGKDLSPAGDRFFLYGTCGDAEFHINELGLSPFARPAFCWYCRCNRDDIPWNDFRDDCMWLLTMVPPHVARADPISKCELFTS